MKVKKGFTLIELIAAIAILGIVFAGVSIGLIAGVRTEKKSDAKLETSTFAKALVENIKVQDESTLKNINTVNYIFFDDKATLEDGMIKLFIRNSSTASTKTDIAILPSKNLSYCSYSSCKAVNQNSSHNNRKYGACILINSTTANRYEVQVWMWDFKFGEGSLAKREFYIRR